MAATDGALDRVIEIFSEVMGVDPAEVGDATAYASFAPWDSLGHMELVARLEEAFGVEFDIEDVIGMETVGRIKAILARDLDVPG